MTTWEALIEYLINQGFADDEIADEFDRAAQGRRGGNMEFPRGDGRFVKLTPDGDPVDWGSLRGRRQVRAMLAGIRGTRAAIIAAGPTDYAREKIPEIARLYHAMSRPSKRGAAELAGVSRDTADDWIARGWMPWPPPRPES